MLQRVRALFSRRLFAQPLSCSSRAKASGLRTLYLRRGGRCHGSGFAGVHQIFEFLTRLEEGNFLRRHFYPLARLGIAADARFALSSAETAKATDFNLVAHTKRAHHAVKNSFDDDFAILASELRQPGYFVNQIGLCHTPLCSVVGFSRQSFRRGPTPCG